MESATKDNNTKIQWHPAFCSAIQLELKADKGNLTYHREHNLNAKPLQIDLSVIKKAPNIVVDNEIGKLFREHNIMEYKSPGASLNIDTFYKVLAYACLYKSSREHVDFARADDITISMVRNQMPIKIAFMKGLDFLLIHELVPSLSEAELRTI